MADKMGWQVDAVRTALTAAGLEPPITPVLCFLRAEWPLLRPPDSFRGVRLESYRSIKRLVSRPIVLTETDMDCILHVLAVALPPK